MGAGVALLAGWTLLLLWADRRPLQHKGVLRLTILVISGLMAKRRARPPRRPHHQSCLAPRARCSSACSPCSAPAMAWRDASSSEWRHQMDPAISRAADHGMLLGDRAGHGAAAGTRGLAGVRHRAATGIHPGPGWQLHDPAAGRHRRGVDA